MVTFWPGGVPKKTRVLWHNESCASRVKGRPSRGHQRHPRPPRGRTGRPCGAAENQLRASAYAPRPAPLIQPHDSPRGGPFRPLVGRSETRGGLISTFGPRMASDLDIRRARASWRGHIRPLVLPRVVRTSSPADFGEVGQHAVGLTVRVEAGRTGPCHSSMHTLARRPRAEAKGYVEAGTSPPV